MLTYVAMENTGVVEGDVGLSRLTHGISWEKTRRFGGGGKVGIFGTSNLSTGVTTRQPACGLRQRLGLVNKSMVVWWYPDAQITTAGSSIHWCGHVSRPCARLVARE